MLFMIQLQQRRSLLHRLDPLLGGLYKLFSRHRIASMIAGQVVVLAILAMFVLNSVLGINIFSAFAQISCSAGSTPYTVQPGDTLGTIAVAHGTSWETLAQQNQIGNPNLIYANHQICVPGNGTTASVPVSQPVNAAPLHNTVNPFSYGQCTWWSSQRYHDLNGFYVPWTTNSNAFQWTARANDFHWHVSTEPSVGAIMNFQGGVQGASSLGHVAVVEQVLGNGDVMTSNMNILGHPFGSVVYLKFHAGPGVTFITA
jgi:surface antigen